MLPQSTFPENHREHFPEKRVLEALGELADGNLITEIQVPGKRHHSDNQFGDIQDVV
jgi:hypothetical protein